MKIKLLLSLIALTTSLYADITSENENKLNLTSGWQLLGAVTDIEMFNFNYTCVDYVWKYNNNWELYTQDSDILSKTSYTEINKIDKGDGFWVHSNNECNIDIKSEKDDSILAYEEIGIFSTSIDLTGKAIAVAEGIPIKYVSELIDGIKDKFGDNIQIYKADIGMSYTCDNLFLESKQCTIVNVSDYLSTTQIFEYSTETTIIVLTDETVEKVQLSTSNYSDLKGMMLYEEISYDGYSTISYESEKVPSSWTLAELNQDTFDADEGIYSVKSNNLEEGWKFSSYAGNEEESESSDILTSVVVNNDGSVTVTGVTGENKMNYTMKRAIIEKTDDYIIVQDTIISSFYSGIENNKYFLNKTAEMINASLLDINNLKLEY